MEIFDLGDESDDLMANTLDDAEQLEPGLGAGLAGRVQFVEIQDFVFEVEIEAAVEEGL